MPNHLFTGIIGGVEPKSSIEGAKTLSKRNEDLKNKLKSGDVVIEYAAGRQVCCISYRICQ